MRPSAGGVGGEVDVDAAVGSRSAGVGQHVVEACGALVGLQAVDDGVSAVVAEDGDERMAGEGRGVELGVEHQVGAVAEQAGDQAGGVGLGTGHGGTPRGDDLVAHAGEAVLEVHRGAGGRPEASGFTIPVRQPPCSSPGMPPEAVST